MQTANARSPLATLPKSIDAIALLDEDHRRMEKIFREFETLPEDTDDETKRGVVERASAALTVHICIEEEIFYPAVQRMLSEKILSEETMMEHSAARELMESLERLETSDPFYDATFVVLAEYVKHHVRNQEKAIFPRIRKAAADWNEVGAQMKQRKDELEDEDGPTENGPVAEGTTNRVRGQV
jgi:hemerythrin-like domain-containing protein